MDRYVTEQGQALAIPLEDGQAPFFRADLEFHGLDHRGDSYEGRVFLNNPEAGLDTPTDPENGYAGSFYVFGHGPCYGDEGHCEVPEGPIHPFDYRQPHPLNREVIVLPITEALGRVVESGEAQLRVTVVPTNVHDEDVGDVLSFERLTLVTYD
jgi:hypothetical protein